ncbi:MAG: hypothetical protein PW788_11385 [Micavibrio sp.]|nr:hypothetical protein [Micavibrio sp.]
MDNREKALEILKAQIRQQRARIDPRILKMAEIAAASTQRPPAATPAGNLVNKPAAKKTEAAESRNSGTVPYDREAATAAITLFLKAHDNPAAVKAQLKALLDKDTQ